MTARAFRPGLLAGGVALLILAIGSQTVMAATALSQSGKRGAWNVRDTDVNPGVHCIYDADVPGAQGNDIDIMTATGPKVFARNRSGRRDGQWVSARIIFQHSVNEGGTGGWVTGKATARVKKFAWDDQAAKFGDRAWEVDVEEDYHFRVIVILRWYKPGSKTQVQGAATVLYQRYLITFGALEEIDADRCPPEP